MASAAVYNVPSTTCALCVLPRWPADAARALVVAGTGRTSRRGRIVVVRGRDGGRTYGKKYVENMSSNALLRCGK